MGRWRRRVVVRIYGLISMVRGGLGPMDGTLPVSAGNAVLFLTPIFGRLGERFGLRRAATVRGVL